MKRIRVNNRQLWNFYVFPLMFFTTYNFTTVACFPTSRPDLEAQPEIRDEKHFPNGTVIGRYTYMDNEGNPIQVKYYADDASYGVELKSIKVVDSTIDSPLVSAVSPNSNSQIVPNSPTNKLDYNLIRNVEADAKITTTDMFNANTNMPTVAAGQSGAKYKGSEPYDFLNKEGSKTNRFKVEKPSPDYEIFYQNELKGPKKCTKEKVRVYFEKDNNRNTRSVSVKNFEADKFCEQF